MNRLTIIGNLTRDPQSYTTASGTNFCTFAVAVNKRVGTEEKTDFFDVTAWKGLADICAKYLSKGKKVAVVGTVSLHSWEQNGEKRSVMDINAEEVEFLSPRGT
jgi:single-strand DNA-binding protein